MAFYTDGVIVWDSLNTHTRIPLTSEFESGYPCGEADQQLFNFTTGYSIGAIGNVLLNSGITPDYTKLLQLARAIQSQKMNFATAGGTANALTLALTPAPLAWSDLVGVPLRVKITATNTGAATLAITGATGTKSLVSIDGTPLQANDLFVGQIRDMVYDGTNVLVLAVRKTVAIPRNAQVFSASGTFVVPTGVLAVRTRIWGAGGGGGGGGNAAAAGRGGGGGAYSEGVWPVTPGASITVTVGVGGTGGNNTGTSGAAGGSTSFGGLHTAGGGAGGFGIGSGIATGGGGFGTASGGLLNLNGIAGAPGVLINTVYSGGQGGGSFGGGLNYALGVGSAGGAGHFIGAGAGGASGANAGGIGADGAVIVEW